MMEQTITFETEKLTDARLLKMEVKTPIHVGAASEKLLVERLDYLVEGDTVYVLDRPKLYGLLLEHDLLEEYTQKLLQARGGNLWDLLDDMNVPVSKVSLFTYSCKDAGSEIRPLIRSGMGQAYLPGSSVKGALRGVVFEHLAQQNEIGRIKKAWSTYRNARDVEQELANYEKDLLGHFGNSLFRFVRPADATLDKTALTNIDLFNLYQEHGGWQSDFKPDFVITAEVFPRGAAGEMRLEVSAGLVDAIRKAAPKSREARTPTHWDAVFSTDDPFKALLAIINTYTRKHLEREIAFFQQYDEADDTDLVISNLTDLLAETKNENSCLLRMAYGSGFHGITGDWRFDDHTYTILKPDEFNLAWSQSTRSKGPARYKSRKIAGSAEYSNLMGFVRLSL
ncbi:MAG: type III-A CRISPR-associated RAMP protein Csm5 [Lewinellaceae bacterium]|nr:type III-A CRISPR-associated RAMP protein Csm5 [Saprospiraceae bacterium]MCB9338550.1 type III-A CRISPR-associated RAMP protein Csm5 [Lewinellaceae bacterium]